MFKEIISIASDYVYEIKKWKAKLAVFIHVLKCNNFFCFLAHSLPFSSNIIQSGSVLSLKYVLLANFNNRNEV